MTRKNKFLTFVAALIPGAGQMYQGHLRRGISIMLLFFGIITVSAIFYIGAINIVLPVVWFVGFFDAMNKSHLTRDELAEIEDKSIFSFSEGKITGFIRDKNRLVGGGIIIAGLVIFYNTFLNSFAHTLYYIFPRINIYPMLRAMPSVFIAVLAIILGIKLIKGNKKAEEEK